MVSGIKNKMKSKMRKGLLFYLTFMILPVLQFVIFYIAVNANSISLAFKNYDTLTDTATFAGFDNFVRAIEERFISSEYIGYLKMSVLMYLIVTVVSIPLGLLFSYYIYKKRRFSEAFRVFLFTPSILSSMVMGSIFYFFAECAIPTILFKFFGTEIIGLFSDLRTCLFAIVFYNIFVSFGVNVLMYANSMCDISPSEIEAAQIDGCSPIQEFFHIVLPHIYPVMVTFIIVGLAGIFTAQYNLFSFFGQWKAPENVKTYGYVLYVKTQLASVSGSQSEFPILSATGLILTAMTIPIVYLVKFLLEKFGPSEE